MESKEVFRRAVIGDVSILDDENAAPYLGARNEYGNTPVHILAEVPPAET